MGAMDERSSRIFVGICLLVLLWIGTYWIYDPGPSPQAATISFDQPEQPDRAAPEQTRTAGPIVPPPPAPSADPGPDARAPVTADPGPTRADPPPARPGTRVVPPEFREHTVAEGETFETIARAYFGDASFGPVVARANPLKDPRRLRAGEVVRVPLDPGNVQGVVVREDGAPEPPPQPDPVVEYVVKPGDSLSRIAQSYYGSVRHADFIFRANADTLASPDRLRVGQTLRLPPLPAGD